MRRIAFLAGTITVGMCAQTAHAQQGWFFECIDPANTTPYSTDYGILAVQNRLIRANLGVSGTVTYGGTAGPCYGAARTLDAPGRFSFMVGQDGSLQTDFDDGMALTVGAPIDAAGDYTYARILKGGQTPAGSALFGDGGLNSAFVGASNRYVQATWTDAEVQVVLQMRVIGDAVRMGWSLRNVSADTLSLGLLFGSYVGMRTSNPFKVDSTGANQANSDLGTATGFSKNVDGYIGWNLPDTTKPARNPRRYASNNPRFPSQVDFMFGQSEAYGLRINNLAPQNFQDASNADLFLIGNHIGPVSGLLVGNNMNLTLPGDLTGVAEEADIPLNETCFLQRFPATPVLSGAVKEVNHYLRSPWSVGDYRDPYTFLVDAPRVVGPNATAGGPAQPNPMTIRAYIDNQFAKLDSEITLSTVVFSIQLPAGLSLAAGESAQKTINTLGPNQIGNVEWRVVSDGTTFGVLPVKITCAPTPGPTKTLTANVQVAALPNMDLPAGANMVGFPYDFPDTSLNSILGLQSGADYIAYTWDAEKLTYVPASTARRGAGYWILPSNGLGNVTLNNARQPRDIASGGLITTLYRGWNLICNPYNFPVKIGDLQGVAEDNPTASLSWQEMVANGFIASSMVYFDRTNGAGAYRYTQTSNDVLAPHQAHWTFVSTFRPLRLVWPAVYTAGIIGSGRSPLQAPQAEALWKLQLTARNANSADVENFVGVAQDRKAAQRLSLPEPPAAPKANADALSAIELSIMDDFMNEKTRMAATFADRLTRKDWTVVVKGSAGETTVTWPNLASLPKNLRARLTDVAANKTVDLRSLSGYSFVMAETGTREFKLTMETGGATRPTIGSVVVTRPTRDVNGPVTITYALSADATVSVRILSGTGREVYSITRGRADAAGENSVTWMLRDSANRAVAPGTYRAEILAESANGERLRKIVPINVTR